eukprot:366230-Pyramimonas_sp.AAC.1
MIKTLTVIGPNSENPNYKSQLLAGMNTFLTQNPTFIYYPPLSCRTHHLLPNCYNRKYYIVIIVFCTLPGGGHPALPASPRAPPP